MADAGEAAELAEEVGAAMVAGVGLGGGGVEDGADAEVVCALPCEEEGAIGCGGASAEEEVGVAGADGGESFVAWTEVDAVGTDGGGEIGMVVDEEQRAVGGGDGAPALREALQLLRRGGLVAELDAAEACREGGVELLLVLVGLVAVGRDGIDGEEIGQRWGRLRRHHHQALEMVRLSPLTETANSRRFSVAGPVLRTPWAFQVAPWQPQSKPVPT